MCDDPLDGPGFLVDASRSKGRRHWRVRALLCEPCYRLGWTTTEDGRTMTTGDAARRRERFEWRRLVGRGAEQPPEPCAACAQMVVRGADPLLKRVTCSHSCSTSLTRKRNGNQGTGQGCAECGDRIDTGRADSRYCSPACRQKAYRQRKGTEPAPTPEVPPTADTRGRRRPRRTQAESLRKAMPVLSGMAMGLEKVGEPEDGWPREELERIAGETDESIAILEGLAAKLEKHTHPHA